MCLARLLLPCSGVRLLLLLLLLWLRLVMRMVWIRILLLLRCQRRGGCRVVSLLLSTRILCYLRLSGRRQGLLHGLGDGCLSLCHGGGLRD